MGNKPRLRALAICIGKRCCPRARSRAVLEEARAYAAAEHPRVHVEAAGCLHVCKKGPIAATFPDVEIKKRVSKKRVRKLIDKLDR